MVGEGGQESSGVGDPPRSSGDAMARPGCSMTQDSTSRSSGLCDLAKGKNLCKEE